MKLQIDIYEGTDDREPVVSHIFYGKTQQAAEAIVKAHMATDSFFRAAMTTGKFRGIPLRIVSHPVQS